MPEVSVIIPTYNSARYLRQAVDSALAQTFTDYEILVIDDGSTDRTEELMSLYRASVRYIRQRNGGVAAARNRGIAESRGRYVAFLDADDTWYPNKLERQISALGILGGFRLCYSGFTLVAPDLTPIRQVQSRRRDSALEDLLLRGNIVGSICAVVCERALFKLVGDFDPSLSQCADWDMWVRLATLTEFLYVDEPLVTYRQHNSNMSRQVSLLEHDSVYLLKKGFAMPGLAGFLRARRQEALARNYMVLAGSYFGVGRYGDFARCAARAVAMDFRQLDYILDYPARFAARWRSRRQSKPMEAQ
jgi:glycosyltransferase involved in cell wall biosynthesis